MKPYAQYKRFTRSRAGNVVYFSFLFLMFAHLECPDIGVPPEFFADAHYSLRRFDFDFGKFL